MYSWASKKEKAQIYLGEPNIYVKLSIFAVVSNLGDFFYIITNACTNGCSYQYFMQEVTKYLFFER